ncbi:hypothetical protein HanXRQr2_Chr03g0101921 [Helianthus annuus]|uniref:Uncharacterized protein n=1 Tax=Helianthus annuus TaxID=4232 RepID=A0A9K3NV52_HELAN|nr:hypothetical protein HanXRQr2_Chr03g0101921 [Helianthus annuus]
MITLLTPSISVKNGSVQKSSSYSLLHVCIESPLEIKLSDANEDDCGGGGGEDFVTHGYSGVLLANDSSEDDAHKASTSSWSFKFVCFFVA